MSGFHKTTSGGAWISLWKPHIFLVNQVSVCARQRRQPANLATRASTWPFSDCCDD